MTDRTSAVADTKMEFGDLTENPFALSARKEKSSKRRALVRAFQMFVLVALATSAVVILSNQSQRWIAGSLTSDFQALNAMEKTERLSQLADLGVYSVEPLVTSMVDRDSGVAGTAYELLRKAQNDWTVLPHEEETTRHVILIDALSKIAIKLPDDRTVWGTSLLQQTLLLASDPNRARRQVLQERANHAIGLLSLSRRPQSGAPDDFKVSEPQRLEVHAEPLPVAVVTSVDEWTTWPPNQEAGERFADLDQASSNTEPDPQDAQGIAQNAQGEVVVRSRAPSVYKSGTNRLQLLGENETVELVDIASAPAQGIPAQEIPAQGIPAQGIPGVSFVPQTEAERASYVTINPTSEVALVDSPLGTFDDVSVMRWLGSPHAVLRDKAKLELVSRGFDGTAIAIASRIHTGDARQKMELIDALGSTEMIDPRPWLMLLLQDESRDVRLHTLSVLGSMDDPAIVAQLRSKLAEEQDPTVAARMRRVLNLR